MVSGAAKGHAAHGVTPFRLSIKAWPSGWPAVCREAGTCLCGDSAVQPLRWLPTSRWEQHERKLRSWLDCCAPATERLSGCPVLLAVRPWRRCASTPPRTTHDLLSRKICYRFHPFHDVEVELVRYLRKTDSSILVVKLPGGVQVAIPEWMLNPQVCDQLKSEDK